MFTSAVNRSDVDIETYFDVLDFDACDLDATNTLMKSSDEVAFQLPEPTCSTALAQELKQPLDQIALDQAAYEVRLLARQLESSPFIALEFTEEHYAIPSKLEDRRFSSLLIKSIVIVSLLFSVVALYTQYNHCSIASTCAKTAKLQLATLSRYTFQPARRSSNVIASSSKPTSHSEPFREAVNQAMRAAVLTQTAKTAQDWEAVGNTWLEAIRLMNTISSSNSKYSIATLKIEEYAKNLAYAQGRMRDAAKRESTASQKPKL